MIAFQWEIKNPFVLETYNCTRLLAVKKPTTLQAQVQDLLLPYVPQFLLLQQGSCYVHEVKTTIHIIQTKLQVGSENSSHWTSAKLPSSNTLFFSKYLFFISLSKTLEWNSQVKLCWWQTISICGYFVSNIWNFGTPLSMLQGQSCFPER